MKPMTLLAVALFACGAFSASPDASVQQHDASYKSWGWDTVLVMDNGIVSLDVVPVIGGRMLQYALGAHEFMWIDDAYKGATYPSDPRSYLNFGGSRTWLAPQDRWGWPPPSKILDYGAYAAQVVVGGTDSALVHVASAVETGANLHQGLQYKRTMTMYRGSSRIRVAMTLANTNAGPVDWSIWEISQNHCPDNQNYWAYFPVRPGGAFGDSGYVGLSGDYRNPGVKPRYRPGISAVQYQGADFKIGSDGTWLCFVDEGSGYVYAKTFTDFPQGSYPDQGSRIQVFSANFNPFMEMEVLSPIATVAGGAEYTFIMDWYAAHTFGPVLSVNKAGVVAQLLEVNGAQVTGRFGVFHVGRADLYFDNSPVAADTFSVSPLDTFAIDRVVAVPEFATSAALLLYDGSGAFVDTLARATLQGSGIASRRTVRSGGTWRVSVANGTVVVSAPTGARAVSICRLDGRQVCRRQLGRSVAGMVVLRGIEPGAYVVNCETGTGVQSLRFVVP